MVIAPKASFTSSSSSSNSESIARFGLRCALFFAPLLGILAFSAVSLYIVGELITPQRVVELQESGFFLYYPLYQPKSVYPSYKLRGVLERHPDVLALGSSRIFSLRNEFVRESGKPFYNAGMFGVLPIGSIRQFLERIPPGQLPSSLLLVVDPWWFREGAQVQAEPDFLEPSSQIQIFDFAWRNGIYCGTQRWALFAPRSLIGANARLQGSGLRPDGSFFPTEVWHNSMPNVVEIRLKKLREGTDEMFRDGSLGLSHDAIEEMQRLLKYCSTHRIRLIGYLSSYHPSLYAALRSDSKQAYIWHVAPALAPMFQEAGAAFFDLEDPAGIGCSIAEYLDEVHESEVCTARALIAMANRDVRAAKVFDAEKLQGFLSRRRSAWQLGF